MTSTSSPADFGRVDADGTVYVQTADGHRAVGQVPDAEPAEALAFYVRRYEALTVEVGLLESRIKGGALSPEEARQAINSLTESVSTANAVGDLASLVERLQALLPTVAEQAEARKAERARQLEDARQAKEKMIAEAETLAEGTDWRGGVNRFRTLLDEWKALPRLDRTSDDALWHRFSTARTTYTRRRKAQFAEMAVKREDARQAKERILAEARELSGSTDWGATAGAFRDLMTRWKAAGAAPREVDDQLWAEFRGLQDQFFAARTSAQSEQDAEFGANLEAKLALLNDAEATLVPVTDLAASRAGFRTFLEKYNTHGRVPREQMRNLDQRVRALEEAIRSAEEREWQRTDPSARARAEETVAMLSAQITKLEAQADKARAKGDTRAEQKAQQAIDTYTSWLDQAKETLADFTR